LQSHFFFPVLEFLSLQGKTWVEGICEETVEEGMCMRKKSGVKEGSKTV
jgi:hypothetical protein